MALQQTCLSYNKEVYPHYFLCHYLPRSAGRDTLSHSLLKFKRSRQPDLEGWIDCALEMLTDMSIPPGAALVRALHHNETTIPDAVTGSAAPGPPLALDLLGQQLAARFNLCYHPRLLQKAHPTRPVKAFGKPRRVEELQGLYSIDSAYAAAALPEGPPKHWLIIDDILTSGATIHAIIQAIQEYAPGASLTIFTLTKAEFTIPPYSPTFIKGRHYQLEQGADWMLAGPEPPTLSPAKDNDPIGYI